MKDFVAIKGSVQLRLKRSNGCTTYWTEENIVVNDGLNLIATLLAGTGTAPTHMSMASGIIPVTATQSALSTTEKERVAASFITAGAVVTITGQLGSGLSGETFLGEFGIFNSAAGGTMLARFITNLFSMDENDVLDVDWALTVE